jgi:hypothetical protein
VRARTAPARARQQRSDAARTDAGAGGIPESTDDLFERQLRQLGQSISRNDELAALAIDPAEPRFRSHDAVESPADCALLRHAEHGMVRD